MATIRKRGPYQYQVEIRRRGYPTQTKTFESKAQAHAWAAMVEGEMVRGVFIDRTEAERTTLAEALERYWREVAARKRHPNQERQRINHWLRQPLAQRFLATLRGADFAKYRDQRRAEGRADNTIRLELALISHLFEIARKEWGMEGLHNPIKNIRKPSGSRERDRRLLPGEYERLAEALSESGNLWARAAFDLAIETSLRQGMLFALRWDWVDLPRAVIRIPPAYRSVGNKGVPAFVPLSSKAVRVLSGLPRSIDGRVLPTTPNAVVCAWKRVLRKLNIKDLRWHDLRHEAASRLFEKGLNPFEVAAITGHKSLNMLRRYTHLQPEALVAKLG